MSYTIVAFYRFTPLCELAALRAALLPCFLEWGLCGTLLLAREGINGTLAGSEEAIALLLERLKTETGLNPEQDHVKFSYAQEKPFLKLKVRLKKEIITFKQPNADPNQQPNQPAGCYVKPNEWNALLNDPDVVVLDTRNAYESRLGSFANAVTPPLEQFTQFTDYVRDEMAGQKEKKIAMFCTGGIRCEKASAFMKAEGFEQVYHLHGGILKYLEEVPEAESLWQGQCYVFDRRIAVGHGLSPSGYGMCFCCGNPVTQEEQTHPLFEEGVSCAQCYETTSSEAKQRYRMRHSQWQQNKPKLLV